MLVNAVCIHLGSLTENMYDVYAVVTCLLLLLSKKDKRWLLCPYSGKQTAIPKRMVEHVVCYSTLHAKAEQAECGRQKEKEAREHAEQVVREATKCAEILEKKLTELQEKQKERANYEAHHRRKFIGATESSPLSTLAPTTWILFSPGHVSLLLWTTVLAI